MRGGIPVEKSDVLWFAVAAFLIGLGAHSLSVGCGVFVLLLSITNPREGEE
jgi:hypothetical protein